MNGKAAEKPECARHIRLSPFLFSNNLFDCKECQILESGNQTFPYGPFGRKNCKRFVQTARQCDLQHKGFLQQVLNVHNRVEIRFPKAFYQISFAAPPEAFEIRGCIYYLLFLHSSSNRKVNRDKRIS